MRTLIAFHHCVPLQPFTNYEILLIDTSSECKHLKMPFPFTLPTTSSFSFSSCFDCDSHPSLPVNASTYRGVMRDTLKKHKRLPQSSQAPNLTRVTSSIQEYAPYLLSIEAAANNRPLPTGDLISIIAKANLSIDWRPTLSGDIVPGRDRQRVKITSLEHELFFTLSTLSLAYVLSARSSLQPLYSISSEHLDNATRTSAITAATKQLLDAASVWSFLADRGERLVQAPSCIDINPAVVRGFASLALAEATMLAVMKDDPYPAAVAQDRNRNDKEWMFRAPEMPKVRAHLYARLSVAASEHAAKAASACQTTNTSEGRIQPDLIKYIEDLRAVNRAKACRFFGVDAELGGQTAEGIGWLRVGLQELGVEAKDAKKGLSFSRLKKDFSERREDRRVDKGSSWGVDAGKLEEVRILEMLDEKWSKVNDTASHYPPYISFYISRTHANIP